MYFVFQVVQHSGNIPLCLCIRQNIIRFAGGDRMVRKWEDVKKNLLTEDERLVIDALAKMVAPLMNARQEQKITLDELAAKISIDRKELGMMESGDLEPSFNALVLWANALGMELTLEKKPAAQQ